MRFKIVETGDLVTKVDALHASGKKAAFTNGCFDILHCGHIRYLNAARREGDILIVALNSDASVQTIKGPLRPIIHQAQRAEVLAGLGCVDYVTIFDEPDPLRLIQRIKPDVVVKGDDWAEDEIIGADIVKANDGRVVRVPVVSDISTSDIIQRIIERYR